MAIKWHEVTVTRVETYMVEIDDQNGLGPKDFISDAMAGDDTVDMIDSEQVSAHLVEEMLAVTGGDNIYPINT